MKDALKAEGLGKKYKLTSSRGWAAKSLAEDISLFLKGKRDGSHRSKASPQEFWALKDVSFAIEPGTRLGVLGKNGAGKSTLLKILSRITEPTEGRVMVGGKMASLLEVGTGFHPELSGRENVFLNGSILGLSRAAIKAKFDEIVAFAGVEKFIDTPVKHYSSGMQVRLAFAVAAHLEPDILILDEVLAVGDATFQKKCLQKMSEISSAGTTVIFVSHGIGAIKEYCNRAMLLEQGQVKLFTTDVAEAADAYLGRDPSALKTTWERTDTSYDTSWFQPTALKVVDENGAILSETVGRGQPAFLEIHGHVSIADEDLTLGYALFDANDAEVFWSYPTDDPSLIGQHCKAGDRIFRTRIPTEILNAGTYSLRLIGGLHNKMWLYQPHFSPLQIDIEVPDSFTLSPYWITRRPGILAVNPSWEIL